MHTTAEHASTSSAGSLARYAVAATLARLADEMVGVSVVLLVLGRTGDFGLSVAAAFGPATAVGTIGVVAVLSAFATAAVPGRQVIRNGSPALLRIARDGLRHLARTPPLR